MANPSYSESTGLNASYIEKEVTFTATHRLMSDSTSGHHDPPELAHRLTIVSQRGHIRSSRSHFATVKNQGWRGVAFKSLNIRTDLRVRERPTPVCPAHSAE